MDSENIVLLLADNTLLCYLHKIVSQSIEKNQFRRDNCSTLQTLKHYFNKMQKHFIHTLLLNVRTCRCYTTNCLCITGRCSWRQSVSGRIPIFAHSYYNQKVINTSGSKLPRDCQQKASAIHH